VCVQVLVCTLFYFVIEFLEFLLENNQSADRVFNEVSCTAFCGQGGAFSIENIDVTRSRCLACICMFAFS